MDGRQARVMLPTFVMGFLPPRALWLISYFSEDVLWVWFIATPLDLTWDWGRLFAWTWLHPICMRMCTARHQDSSCYLTKILLCCSLCLFGFHWDMMWLFCFFSGHIPHLPAVIVHVFGPASLEGHWGDRTELYSQLVWLLCPQQKSFPPLHVLCGSEPQFLCFTFCSCFF